MSLQHRSFLRPGCVFEDRSPARGARSDIFIIWSPGDSILQRHPVILPVDGQ